MQKLVKEKYSKHSILASVMLANQLQTDVTLDNARTTVIKTELSCYLASHK